MTIRDFIETCDRELLDIEVVSNYTDELDINYVGDPSVRLTQEGEREFRDILSLEIELRPDSDFAIVTIPDGDEDQMDECETRVSLFFNACAGNVAAGLYERWFEETGMTA